MSHGRRSPPVFPFQGGHAWDWSGYRAHLTRNESALSKWYLKSLPVKPLLVWYDVATDGVEATVKSAAPADTSILRSVQRGWQRLTSKRIDMATFDGTVYRVIEFRAVTKQQTLGEVITYDKLTRSEWPALAWGNVVLVTQSIDPITRRVLESLPIDLVDAPNKVGFSA